MNGKKINNVNDHNSGAHNKGQTESPIPFTARLMAHYRAEETKLNNPLFKDPYAKQLAGDISEYLENHKRYSRMDYPLVRSYYIDETQLKPWVENHSESQIILLGCGLDTRAYRLKYLEKNEQTIFEIDLPSVITYKSKLLKDEKAYCNIKRIRADLSNFQWISKLKEEGYSEKIPTIWILEGIVYYLKKSVIFKMLQETANITSKSSKIFIDVCIPIFAEVKVSPFSRYFKWGIERENISSFFAKSGWEVTSNYADEYDYGRDVGQKGMIYVQGYPIRQNKN